MTRRLQLVRGVTLWAGLIGSTACGGASSAPVPKAQLRDAPAGAVPAELGGSALSLDAAKSKVGFVGRKVTGSHEGSFADFDGKLAMSGDEPTGLTLSVRVGSVASDDPKLTEHLKSDDFFAATQHPVASFDSGSIRAKPGDGGMTHEIEGVLELRGTRKTIVFPAKVDLDKDTVRGVAAFSIDRRQFGIEYDGMADDLIKDDVVLAIDLVFPRV